MSSRRSFVASMVGATAALPAFREEAIAQVVRAESRAGERPPLDVAADESYWAEIQRAFDTDRTMVNLNNGGVCPTPTHVLEAMIRDLRFSKPSSRKSMDLTTTGSNRPRDKY